MSEKILCIDTSLDVCSVALAIDGAKTDLFLEEKGFNIHGSRLNIMIQNLMDKAGIKLNDLDAVCIDKGPGSYTGLRIGVSTAKGLCYALEIPLISLGTLETMAIGSKDLAKTDILCPMIDARRMEVYFGLYDAHAKMVEEPKAAVLDENFLANLLAEKRISFFGNGMDKARKLLEHQSNAVFMKEDIYPSAQHMTMAAIEKFEHKEFEDLYNFEPFYLKDFYTTAKTMINDK